MIRVISCSACAGWFGATHLTSEFLTYDSFLSRGEETARTPPCWLCERRAQAAAKNHVSPLAAVPTAGRA